MEGVGSAAEDDPALDGDVVVVPEASSGKDDNVCCCWVSLLAALASTSGRFCRGAGRRDDFDL
jgi:hypothetical protein